ncbi:unnamed protein product [Rhodiola kirilowii]
MASEANSREARRRRIVDRGTDRLALITGRIQSLPDASSITLHQSSQSPDADSPIHIPESIHASSETNEKVKESPFSDTNFTNEEAQSSKNHAATAVQSHIPDPKPSIQSSENVFSASFERPQSTIAHSVSGTAQMSQPRARKPRLPFTPRQISSSVTESESLRNFCSFIVASMVVLSYAGFPILRCSLIKNVILFRPLFLLLITNITIVVAPLLEGKQGGRESSARESDETSVEGPGMAEQLGNALEIGLLVQKVIGALFMDCSIYSVIVVSGLSLFQ